MLHPGAGLIDTATMLRMARHLLSVIALALVLGVVAFVGTAEAAGHDHHPAAMAGHHQHGAMAEADSDAPPEGDPGPLHGAHCHCVSAVCAPAIEPGLSSLTTVLAQKPLRHGLPAGLKVSPLASVDPPPRPPRA